MFFIALRARQYSAAGPVPLYNAPRCAPGLPWITRLYAPRQIIHCTHTHVEKHRMFVGGAVHCARCVCIGSPCATGEPTPFCLHVLDYIVFPSLLPVPSLHPLGSVTPPEVCRRFRVCVISLPTLQSTYCLSEKPPGKGSVETSPRI